MGKARLNVWIRRPRCCTPWVDAKFFLNITDGCRRVPRGRWSLDQGKTWCSGKLAGVPVNPADAHVEIELPPGCYVVGGYMDKCHTPIEQAMVIVGCDEIACVNLLAGYYKIMLPIIPAFEKWAKIARIDPKEIERTIKTLKETMKIVPEEEKVAYPPEVVEAMLETVTPAAKEVLEKHKAFLTEILKRQAKPAY